MSAVTAARYSAVAITLHWLIAVLLIGNIGLAWYFNTLTGLERVAPTQLHKSIGITVLLLSLLRLAWRLAVKPPPLPAGTPAWERRVAGATHLLFYVVMLGLPLTGWFMVSASPLIHAFPIKLYGLVEWPAIGPLTTLPHDQMHATHEAFETAHGLLAKLSYGLIVLHVGAALMHQFVRRDVIVPRMVPFLRRPA
ncbi:cytochrome b [Caulobacter sp. KR2-114]|uniref:cytochrome b n=1 Tax=Caulobacter sp. KR2-114 TaxID=3400912 RepID=UPI003C00920D